MKQGLSFLVVFFCGFFAVNSFADQIAWYVTFSGESATPINQVYALSTTTGATLGSVTPNSNGFDELRSMAIGPDGKLYVVNSNKLDSRILQFGSINPDGLTRNYLGTVVSPSTSYGVDHPYQVTFSPLGNMYISAQDTNLVLGIYGPLNAKAFSAMPLSSFLSQDYASGTFAPGTFVPAFSALSTVAFTPIPPAQGGLTYSGASSVRGIAFGPNHALYVSDEGNNRVMVFDSNTGDLINIIASKDTQQPDQLFFNMLNGLIYIACPGSNRILTYDPKTNALNTFIHDSTHLSQVSGIAFGEDGNFYAADRATMQIYRYDAQGNYLGVFAGPFADAPEGLVPVYSTLG